MKPPRYNPPKEKEQIDNGMLQRVKNFKTLREQLHPTYGVHTDAVISMLGANPHKNTVEAAKQRNLTEAEAAHYSHGDHSDIPLDYPHRNNCSLCPLNHASEFQEGRDIAVPWISKPLKPKPGKKPEIEIVNALKAFNMRNDLTNGVLHIFINGKLVGESQVARSGKPAKKKLWVDFLQQKTNRISSREARKFEGWKNAFMEQLEQIARSEGITRIYFSTGSHHIERNISTRPIHPEVLETYGRLPMQHGYTLQPVKYDSRLWWVKRL